MDCYPAIVWTRTPARTHTHTRATENNSPSPINWGTKYVANNGGILPTEYQSHQSGQSILCYFKKALTLFPRGAKMPSPSNFFLTALLR